MYLHSVRSAIALAVDQVDLDPRSGVQARSASTGGRKSVMKERACTGCSLYTVKRERSPEKVKL